MWQGDQLCDILRLDEYGQRLYWTYLLLVPRKNSKSLLGAGLAIDGLLDEPGAEVYSCAADKDQAKLIFKEVRAAVEASPDLDAKQGGLFKVYRDAIEYPATDSVYKALSAEAFTKEGLNPSRVLFDELHAQPNWDLWNVMNQGSDTREAPLVVAISTFGVKTDSTGETSVCKAQYDYAKRIRNGEVTDPRFGFRIYETNAKQRGFDHRNPKFWAPANPALGDFLHVEKMAATCSKMLAPDFKTKRCNIWINSINPWLPDGGWERRALAREIPDLADVVLALDGSFNGDCTGLVVCTIEEVPHLDVVELWQRPHDAGEEWQVPILDVEDAIREACKRWNVEEIAMDLYRWARTYQILDDERLPVTEFPQSPQRMTPATTRFYEAVMNGTLTQSGDRRFAAHVGNAVLKSDSRGTRIYKEHRNSPLKIDLAVCGVMAHDRAAWWAGNSGPNIW